MFFCLDFFYFCYLRKIRKPLINVWIFVFRILFLVDFQHIYYLYQQYNLQYKSISNVTEPWKNSVQFKRILQFKDNFFKQIFTIEIIFFWEQKFFLSKIFSKNVFKVKKNEKHIFSFLTPNFFIVQSVVFL